MTHVYLISGLGADHTVFERLTWRGDISVHHLPWLNPAPNEAIGDYALRMAASIENPKQATVIGLSFGGVMAIEIGKRIPVKRIVLISSVKSKAEMPINLNLIGLFNLHKFIPASKLLHFKELTSWFFGVRGPKQKKMLFDLLDRTDEVLVDWSADQIVSWQGEHNLTNILHIHGTADTVFPLRNVQADCVVQGGPHFMDYTHAASVSTWLNHVI